MMDAWNSLLNAITNSQPENLFPVLLGLTATFSLIYYFRGRFWAFLYFATIPFLNWSFGVVDSFTLAPPGEMFERGIELHPLTVVTGLVFVFRDFVQRQMGHRVLIVMALALAWSCYSAWPVIALAAPVDTTIFLYGADLARQMKLGDEPGNMLHLANWIVFVVGKMIGAVIISYMIRQREKAGDIDPYDDDGFTPEPKPAVAD